jgi:cytochrome c5
MHPILKAAAVLVAATALPAAAVTLPGAPAMTDKGKIVGPFKFPEHGGPALYKAVCQGCHMADGAGAVGAGSYPALANDLKTGASEYVISRVLNGYGAMPSFKSQLDDQQVADVVAYVRTHFGNHYPAEVTRDQVKAMRQLTSGPAQAQTLPDVPTLQARGFDEIRSADLRRELTYIASDAFEGRMSLQPGDARAMVWIAQQFAAAGLKPADVDGSGKASYLQPVPLVEYAPDPAGPGVTVLRGGKSTTWSTPDVTGFFKSAIDISGQLVFAGYGITAPELGYDDYAGVEVRGKIALVFDHEPQEDDPQSNFNGTGITRYAAPRVKLLNAQHHGALAVLIVPEPNRKHLSGAELRSRNRIGTPTRVVAIPNQSLKDDEVTIPLLTVTDRVAADLMSSSPVPPQAAQSAIDATLQPHSMVVPDIRVSIHLRNLSQRQAVSYNVVGLLRGSDPRLSAETVIISAHHDHEGISACADPAHPQMSSPPDPKPCPEIWHGADDNGSGTVGVVALARAFAANSVRPKRSVLFVVFASEERGLLGSYWMAAHPLRPLATTRAVINFDMIGRDETKSPQTDGILEIPPDTSNRLNLVGTRYSPDYNRVIQLENAAVGLTLDYRFENDHVLNILFRSDQFPFILHDVPAFWWFTGFHPDYHHTTDTADKIDFPKMEKILRLAYLTSWRLADDRAPPRFVSKPHSPQVGATGKAQPVTFP